MSRTPNDMPNDCEGGPKDPEASCSNRASTLPSEKTTWRQLAAELEGTLRGFGAFPVGRGYPDDLQTLMGWETGQVVRHYTKAPATEVGVAFALPAAHRSSFTVVSGHPLLPGQRLPRYPVLGIDG